MTHLICVWHKLVFLCDILLYFRYIHQLETTNAQYMTQVNELKEVKQSVIYSLCIYEGCPRSSWTTAVTLSFFRRFGCFLYKIHFKHIRIKNHQHYFNTSSYVSKTRFHRDQGNVYRRTGKSC